MKDNRDFSSPEMVFRRLNVKATVHYLKNLGLIVYYAMADKAWPDNYFLFCRASRDGVKFYDTPVMDCSVETQAMINAAYSDHYALSQVSMGPQRLSLTKPKWIEIEYTNDAKIYTSGFGGIL